MQSARVVRMQKNKTVNGEGILAKYKRIYQ